MDKVPEQGPSPQDVATFTTELFARLGLNADASALDIASAHDERIQFLEQAPLHQQGWAKAEMEDADEALALLSGSLEELAAATPISATGVAGTGGSAGNGGTATAVKTRPAPVPRSPGPPSSGIVVEKKTIAIVVGILVVIAVVVGVYKMGGSSVPEISGTPDTSASAAPLDEAKVSALMQKIAANPNDAAALIELGDVYFQAGQFKVASEWLTKALVITPKDPKVGLALGAAYYNLGDTANAETQWLKVVKIDPNNAEAHYDLGFLALSKTPPDMKEVKAQWQKVVDIDPTSELAKTVGTHLTSIDNPSTPASTKP